MSSLSLLWLAFRGLPKTVLFNLRYLPLRQAWRLPVLVSHRVWLKTLGGRVRIEADEVRTGMIRLGFGDVGIFDQHRSRSVWQVSGEVVWRGRASLGHGCKISVSGRLDVGDGLIVTAESAFVAHRSVTLGRGVLISWDVLVMDSDFHPLVDADGRRLNEDAPVVIGDGVWIGARVLVLKGTTLAPGTVVAAASTVTRSVDTPQQLIGGSPATPIREGVRWT